jgi:bisphosphoglycerate-independent phosphoglycerate mutase (AlkP superfamily)
MPALQRRVASSQESRSISFLISKKQRWAFSRKDFLHKKETTIMEKYNATLKISFQSSIEQPSG